VIALAGLALLAAAELFFVASLVARRTFAVRAFDALVVLGAAVAVLGWRLEAGAPWWPAAAAGALALVWFAATRKELALPPGALRVGPGDRLPAAALVDTAGAIRDTTALTAGGPVLLVLYRGWWCPFCVTQLRDLGHDLDALRAAGLTVVAVSVDRPDEQRPLEARLGGRVVFLSDERGVLLDALGVRHEDGVPWYDRLLFGARRQDIATPAILLVDGAGVIRFARRSRSIDDRPPVADIVAAWTAARRGTNDR
jgi:peroxiredoxin